MNKRPNILAIAFTSAAALLLAGCLTWETIEMKVVFDRPQSNHAGNISVNVHRIGSQSGSAEGRMDDLRDLVYDVAAEGGIPGEDMTAMRKSLFLDGDSVSGSMSGRFQGLSELKAASGVEVEFGRFAYVLSTGEEVVDTNGEVTVDKDGTRHIEWPMDAAELRFVIRNIGTSAQPGWKPAYSLHEEYAHYLADKDAFDRQYVRDKLAEADAHLRKSLFREAYSDYRDVLRIDPDNGKALKGAEGLGFVRFYEAVEAIPLPAMAISFGVDISHGELAPERFMDVRAAIRELDKAASAADGPAKGQLYCQMSRLYGFADQAGHKGRDAVKYRKKAVRLLDTNKNQALTSDQYVCLADLYAADDDKEKALENYRNAARINPRQWAAYKGIFGILGGHPEGAALQEFGSWITEGDLAMSAYLQGIVSEITAAEAYGVFDYMFSRNVSVLRLKGASTMMQNPVNELAYEMLRHAVELEPDNPSYRGMLGSVELWLAFYVVSGNVDTSAPNAGEAFMQSLERSAGDLAPLINEASGNMDYLIKSSATPPYRNIAFMALLKKDLEQAERMYIKNIEAEPDDEEPYLALTAFYAAFYSEGSVIHADKAEKLMALMQKKLAPSANEEFIMGKLLMAGRGYGEAAKRFSHAMKKDPSHYPAAVGYFKAALLIDPARSGEMPEEIDGWIVRHGSPGPAYDELRFVKAMALAMTGQRDKALDLLTSILPASGEGLAPGLRKAILAVGGVAAPPAQGVGK